MEPERFEMRRRVAETFLAAIPHCRTLGMELFDLKPAEIRIKLPYDPQLVGDPETGVLHGGVVTTLLDSASGAAVVLHPTEAMGTATIDLRIDYMRPSTPGEALYAHARCYHATRNVAFVRAFAYENSEDDPVAVSNGAFTIDR